MKDYTTDNPVFSEIIKIFETTDRAHAEVLNTAVKQLFENTLALKNKSDDSYITDDDTSEIYRIGKDSGGVYIELSEDTEESSDGEV